MAWGAVEPARSTAWLGRGSRVASAERGGSARRYGLRGDVRVRWPRVLVHGGRSGGGGGGGRSSARRGWRLGHTLCLLQGCVGRVGRRVRRHIGRRFKPAMCHRLAWSAPLYRRGQCGWVCGSCRGLLTCVRLGMRGLTGEWAAGRGGTWVGDSSPQCAIGSRGQRMCRVFA